MEIDLNCINICCNIIRASTGIMSSKQLGLAVDVHHKYGSPKHLGLAVDLHHKYGSRDLIEKMYKLGYSKPYSEPRQFPNCCS